MITKLLNTNEEKGNIRGRCVVCGELSENGYNYPFSDNFAGWSYLVHGNCCCPNCYYFFKNSDFRKKSWWFGNRQLTFCKRHDFETLILFPPEPPFFFYFTTTGQKQGWLTCLRKINLSKDSFFISTDKWGDFSICPKTAKQYNKLIVFLRTKGATKGELISGNYGMNRYKVAIIDGWIDKLNEAKGSIKRPIWEVMTYVAE